MGPRSTVAEWISDGICLCGVRPHTLSELSDFLQIIAIKGSVFAAMHNVRAVKTLISRVEVSWLVTFFNLFWRLIL